MRYIALVLSLPTRNATARMRAWRALKGLGCGVLRDGVYLLPEVDGTEQRLARVAGLARDAGGNAELVSVEARDAAQEARLRSLFDRSAAYADLRARVREFRSGLRKAQARDLARRLRGLQRDFRELAEVDYFSGEARAQVEHALHEAEAAANAVLSPGEPHAARRSIARLDRNDYRGRTWATRKRPWVDRLASAWLIKRFIDPKAKFIWLDSPRDCPKRALGYDFDGAAFTHVGSRVTFETLTASFGLEQDPALGRIGELVHYLDVGGVPVPEAPGVVALLGGMRKEPGSDDDAMLARASKLFDQLYASFSENA
jgi:hypothetical protein